MNHEDIKKALRNLNPLAEWNLSGTDYADLVWLSKDTKPTLAEIEAEIALLPAKEAEAKAKIKADREALLAKLGINADEAKLLLQ